MMQRSMVVLASVLALGACGSGSEHPISPQAVIGEYSASTLEVTGQSGVTDYLELGGQVDLRLESDNSFSSLVVWPGAGEGGGPLISGASGTWRIVGRKIRLQSEFESVLRDIALEPVQGGQLRGELAVTDGLLRVVFDRQ
jgi:hypothetical protein